MHARRPLICFLFLLVLFNAIVAAPAHDGLHIARQGVEAAQRIDSQVSAQTEDEAPDAETHARCTWCLAHAFDVAASLATAEWGMPATVATLAISMLSQSFVPGTQRWRFASRDPPAAAC